ncbi:DUF6781 family protein [Sulfurimonas sp.]
MDTQELQKKLQEAYNKRYKSVQKRVTTAIEALNIDADNLSLDEITTITNTVVDTETSALQLDVEKLLEEKEAIERALEKKSEELQELKYEVFHAIEDEFKESQATLAKIHQIKLQSIDLYDILSEMVESAIITALEKDSDGDISEPTIEVIKEITFESIKEGSLNTIRIRKILSTILATAIDVAEASPNRAQEILSATLKGMRGGLIRSIDRFKKRLAYMPVEAKHILIEDYDTIIEDLHQTDTLFSQVVVTQASESSPTIRKVLIDLNKEMHYDLEELVHISKEAAELMKEKFSNFAKLAVKKADVALNSPKAKEAKRMGIQAWEVARGALGTAIKSAKDAIDKKDK